MVTVLVAIHLLIAAIMIGLILLQKNEGGAAGAGIAASASIESMMRPRARPNPIGRATAIFGMCFFATSLGLALLARPNHVAPSIMAPEATAGAPQVPKVAEPTPAAPAATAPAATPEAPSAPTVPTK